MSARPAQPLGGPSRRLKVKTEMLLDAARQYAHGVASEGDLKAAAIEFGDAAHEARERRGEDDE